MNNGLLSKTLDGIPSSAAYYAGVKMRPYGIRREDLDITFSRLLQPYAVTSVLQACLSYDEQKIPAGMLWGWSLSRRLQMLLSIAVLSHNKTLDLQVRCKESGCAELFELPLDLNRFQQEIDEIPLDYEVENAVLQLRLPDGLDQLRWLDKSQTPETMARDLVVSCNGDVPDETWSVPSNWLHGLGEFLEKQDHLTALQLQTQCPLCNAAMNIDFDLESHLLQLFAYKQAALLGDIHRMALVYHWSETEIMSLTAERRKAYLGFIDEGGWS